MMYGSFVLNCELRQMGCALRTLRRRSDAREYGTSDITFNNYSTISRCNVDSLRVTLTESIRYAIYIYIWYLL